MLSKEQVYVNELSSSLTKSPLEKLWLLIVTVITPVPGVYGAFVIVCCVSPTAVIVLEVPDAGSVDLGYE